MVLAHNIKENLRTQDVKISEDVTFDTMLLSTNTLKGLHESGFHKPSPIQLHGIPLGKCGFDLLLEAKSGTGKTAVFSVIALEKLDLNNDLQVIILTPTREIAAQICNVIKQIGSGYKNLCVEVVMGGLPVHDDIAKFKKRTHIVVGSPGRLRHLIQDNHIKIEAVRLLVLDEADKLMDKSFQADINYIFSILPKQKQVIMSSATYPQMLKTVINKYVSNGQHICPDSTSILLGIKQLFTVVKANANIVRQTQHRFEELLNILSKKQFKQCLIFCNYQVRVGELSKMLMREKWPAEQLHGQQEQTDRLEALKTLQQYKCRILISTDLAARGIDASNVDLVINFEPPFDWQTYLHRIGRAGRFGSYGVAITILSAGQEQLKFKKMLESISVSLKLKNVWDDDEMVYDLPASDTNVVTTKPNFELQPDVDQTLTTKNNLHEEMWTTLNENNIENIDDILGFEELNKSFEDNEKCEMITFSELMNSFTTLEDSTAESIPYKHMNFQKITVNKCSLSLKSNEQKESKLNITSNSKINIPETKEKLLQNINSRNVNEDSRFRQLKNKLKQKLKQKFNVQCNVDDESDFHSNPQELNKALIEAGLPTSFGGNETNTRRISTSYTNMKYNHNANINNQQNIMEEIEQTDSNIHQESRYVHNNDERCEDEIHSDSEEGNSLSNSFLKSRTNGVDDEPYCRNRPIKIETRQDNGYESGGGSKRLNKINSYLKNKEEINGVFGGQKSFKIYKSPSSQHATSNRNSRIRSDSSTSNEEISSDSMYCNYYTWHNQLKAHVKQVEMFLYIEDLSKIK